MEWPHSSHHLCRVMRRNGRLAAGAELHEPVLEADTLLHMYRTMATMNVFDAVMYDAQRQGRIFSFTPSPTCI